MATIDELLAKHSKIPGDIWVGIEGNKFRPFFKSKDDDFVGLDNQGSECSQDNIQDDYPDDRPVENEWEFLGYYEQPKSKVKRALYAIYLGGDSPPYMPPRFYKNHAECRQHQTEKVVMVTRLMWSEMEFEQ